jgi:hypothetical protein
VRAEHIRFIHSLLLWNNGQERYRYEYLQSRDCQILHGAVLWPSYDLSPNHGACMVGPCGHKKH